MKNEDKLDKTIKRSDSSEEEKREEVLKEGAFVMPIDNELLDHIQNKAIGEFNLSGKDLDDDHILQLCDAKILSLNLGSNKITSKGAETLAKNKFLIALNLNNNQIGDEGAEALAQNKTLTSLYLYGNQIGDKGAAALIQGLQNNYALTSLSMAKNAISDTNNEIINKLLARNCLWRDQFHRAVKEGDVQTLGKCLAQGVSLASTSGYPESNTALHWAVQKQQKAIVKILLNVIMNQDVQHYHQITNLKGVTAAQLASTLGNKDIIALFQQSSQNIGTKEYWYKIGEKFYNEKQYIQAIENFDKALSLDKKYKEAWNKKGWALGNLKAYHDAWYCFNKALDIDKNYREAWRGRAQVHLNASIKGDRSFWYNLGVTLYEVKEYAEVVECFNRYFKLSGKSTQALCYQARAFYEIGEYNKAITYCDDVLKTPFSWQLNIGSVLNTKIFALWKLDRYNKIADCYKFYFQNVSNEDPQDQTLESKTKALLLQKFGKYKKAIELYTGELERDSENKEAWHNKGMALFNLGEYTKAIECYDNALKTKSSWTLKSLLGQGTDNSENEAIWNNKGLVLSYQENYFDALDCYSNALRLNIDSQNALVGKGYVLCYQMKFNKAEACFEKALALDPYSAYALQGKGLVAYQKENFKQAEEYFQKAEAHISPDKSFFEWSELFCRQGKVFMSLKAWDKVQEAFNKALTFDPKNFPAQKALEELNQVSKSTPDTKKNQESNQLYQSQQRILANQLQIEPHPFPEVNQSSFSPADEDKPFANMEISFYIAQKELKLGKELGRGSFGIVFQGTFRYNDVAIKQLVSTQLSKDALEEFQSETKIMARLRSPNIVQLYGITDSIPYCMVMEYLPKGDLYNLLHSKEELSWEQRAQIALDIARGLAYLHKENIMHRDLKSKNVLLDKSLQAKLADFGLSKIRTESSITSTGNIVGTLAWMSPEIINGETYTLKADIYSYGVILWELSSRQAPFSKANGNQVLIATWVSNGKRDEIPQETPAKLAKLIAASWAQEPQQRSTAEQAIQQLQAENMASCPATKPGAYRSNFDSTSMDSGYRDNFDSNNNGFRP